MNLEDISTWLGQLGGAPGYVLVFLFCIGAIKGLRTLERFPNDGAWLASLLLGAVLNSLIADPNADGFSLRVWLIKNALFGGVIGFMAALGYEKVLKRYIKFFDGDEKTEGLKK